MTNLNSSLSRVCSPPPRFSTSLWKVRPPIEACVVLIRDTHGLFARVPSRTLFFHVGPDSSHNTSKVTKAEGKQIWGRALTGLLNTRAPRRWSPSLLKVATTRMRTTATSMPPGHLLELRRVSRRTFSLRYHLVKRARRGALYVRKTKTISPGGGKERAGRRS